MNKGKEFSVEISNTGSESYATATTLEMPATWAEFHDALHQARISDGRICHNELLQVRRKEFPSALIGRDVNLYELNLLAQRLAMLTDEQDFAFEGLLKMKQSKTSGPIPLCQLINLTFQTDSCCVASNVFSYKGLGELLFEGEMLPNEAITLLEAAKPNSEYKNSLLTAFGKKRCEDEGGVITSRGYVEAGGGAFKEVYVPGEMAYFERSGAPVVLEVSKNRNGGKKVTLNLPAAHGAVDRLLEALDAASPEECTYRCADCLIPAAKEIIDNAMDMDGVNKFAKVLEQMERRRGSEDQIKYKALLEASGCTDLDAAAKLLDELDAYELRPEITEPWDYAKAVLKEKYPDLSPALFQTSQFRQIGNKMLEESNADLTSYGLIRRTDGGPLPVLEQKHTGTAMEMGEIQ